MSKFRDKQEVIFDTASEVFMQKGFSGASIQEIADKAGIGKGTIYEYFNSKDELFIFVVKQKASSIVKSLCRMIEEEKTFKEKIIDMLDFLSEPFEKAHRFDMFLITQFAGLAENSVKELNQVIEGMKLEFTGILSRVLMQGIKEGIVREVDVEVCSYFLLSLIQTYTVKNIRLKDEDEATLKEEKLNALDLLLNGIGAK